MYRILFLSSEHTGSGHKSIIEALSEQLLLLSPDIQFSIIDGFDLGNWFLRSSSRSYDSFAVKFPLFWGFIYQLGNPFKALVNWMVGQNIRKSLLKQIDAFHPDLIVSVHNLFVGSVINVLDRADLDIPVISLIADLDNVTDLWADKRAKYIICPSEEVKQIMLHAGMTNDQLFLTGFPVRRKFCDVHLPKPLHWRENEKNISVLLMSGSQGSAQILKIAQTLLNDEKIRITIIAGHNTSLKKFLEKALSPYVGKRVSIYGFIREVEKRMMEADLLILRASPNVLMEAVNLCRPIIVTGALRGQEAKNPQFVLKHQLGLYCRDISSLPNMISALFANHGEKLMQISKSQYLFRKPESAHAIAQLLIQTAKETHTSQDQPIA
ncbi:galactosyldiacylglycerol synthase [Sporolactobacillus shoreae]|uniref:Galactosyldiacylglycerol synthase n=1 Tax=Sporolactobacillus shoreae TaxID=1465501 RepID=A0A4Z0GQL5_9BACL|nr:glycosyltransferase [Sporolactobacillus shoreae]TGA98333.1 galactosyldiacylglycerol synthase [Sporolactobacillus shoreae]